MSKFPKIIYVTFDPHSDVENNLLAWYELGDGVMTDAPKTPVAIYELKSHSNYRMVVERV